MNSIPMAQGLHIVDGADHESHTSDYKATAITEMCEEANGLRLYELDLTNR